MCYSEAISKAFDSDFGAFSKCRYVAITLETGDPVDGDENYCDLEDRLENSEEFGKNYRSKITIIGPRRECTQINYTLAYRFDI